MNDTRTRLLSALLLVAALSACTGMPDGVETVDGVDPERYLGTWYEIARLDHRFERGLEQVTATYSRRDDGGIGVLNRGYKVDDGEWSQVEGRAYPIEEGDWSRLKVSFFGPFYGAYNIVALDHDEYRWAMVVGYNRDYLWILAREPQLDPAITERLIDRARDWSFPVEDLHFVYHDSD
jgi:apolipoprotein D and lipocalin family protein